MSALRFHSWDDELATRFAFGFLMLDKSLSLRRLAVPMILIAFAVPLMFTSFLREHPGSYPPADLSEAKKYVDALPGNTRILLTPDNQPVTKFVTAELAGNTALEKLRLARRIFYRPTWGLGDIEVIVISNFLSMAGEQRQRELAKYNLRGETVRILTAALPSDNGCATYQYEDNGWSGGGFLLVDPAAASMAQADVTSCVIAGFDHLLGVPLPKPGSIFDFRVFSRPDVSAVILAYMKQCSYENQTDVSPRSRSNYGITNFPSVRCIGQLIGNALRH